MAQPVLLCYCRFRNMSRYVLRRSALRIGSQAYSYSQGTASGMNLRNNLLGGTLPGSWAAPGGVWPKGQVLDLQNNQVGNAMAMNVAAQGVHVAPTMSSLGAVEATTCLLFWLPDKREAGPEQKVDNSQETC